MNIFTRLFFPIFILEKYIIYCQIGTQNSCYDASGKARTCITYPKNAAYEALPGRKIVATNTCGTPPAQFCVIGPQTKCQICNASDINNSYPPNKMIDLHNPSNPTWWQSQNWWETNQLGLSTLSSPLTVNVTVSLNKHYLLSGGVYLTFQSVRPKQMVLYRSIDYGKTWKAYQFYSKNCTISYGMQADPPITNTNRFDATCSEKFSSETPFANGVVFFDPRKTRYTTGQYFNSDVHQYLKASDIRVRLEYPGTDGREYINQEETLNQYYYAISDFQIDARCDCQGHAEFCDTVNGTEVCDCKHFTTGRDCDMCLPLYNNRPWTAGNATDANECQSKIGLHNKSYKYNNYYTCCKKFILVSFISLKESKSIFREQ